MANLMNIFHKTLLYVLSIGSSLPSVSIPAKLFPNYWLDETVAYTIPTSQTLGKNFIQLRAQQQVGGTCGANTVANAFGLQKIFDKKSRLSNSTISKNHYQFESHYEQGKTSTGMIDIAQQFGLTQFAYVTPMKIHQMSGTLRDKFQCKNSFPSLSVFLHYFTKPETEDCVHFFCYGGNCGKDPHVNLFTVMKRKNEQAVIIHLDSNNISCCATPEYYAYTQLFTKHAVNSSLKKPSILRNTYFIDQDRKYDTIGYLTDSNPVSMEWIKHYLKNSYYHRRELLFKAVPDSMKNWSYFVTVNFDQNSSETYEVSAPGIQNLNDFQKALQV